MQEIRASFNPSHIHCFVSRQNFKKCIAKVLWDCKVQSVEGLGRLYRGIWIEPAGVSGFPCAKGGRTLQAKGITTQDKGLSGVQGKMLWEVRLETWLTTGQDYGMLGTERWTPSRGDGTLFCRHWSVFQKKWNLPYNCRRALEEWRLIRKKSKAHWWLSISKDSQVTSMFNLKTFLLL